MRSSLCEIGMSRGKLSCVSQTSKQSSLWLELRQNQEYGISCICSIQLETSTSVEAQV